MHIFSFVISFFHAFSQVVPLDIFVFVGSFLEEVISPIPAILVTGTAGAIAVAGHFSLLHIFWLGVLAGLGKTVGAWFYYIVGDKLEDIIVRRFGGFFGVTHIQMEGIGKRFTGHWKDMLVLATLRFLPFSPTTPISVACGVIRMDLRIYLLATFLGSVVKDTFYLVASFFGLSAARRSVRYLASFHPHASIFATVVIVLALFLLWYHRKKGVWLWKKLRNKLKIQMTNIKSKPKLK